MKKLAFILTFFMATIMYAQVKQPGTNQGVVKKEITGCKSGNCNDGWGKWQYENGYYSGFWKDGKRHGYGLYDWKKAGKYIGFWDNNSRTGYGVYFYDDGNEMSGIWKNGELEGFGKKYADGKWSQGVYENGKLTTKHDFYDNKKETGCVAGDCQNKYGRFVWSNGDKFTGFFKNGVMYMGSYSFKNGDKYSGMFNEEGKFHGSGRFFFKDKSYYGGNWKDGKYHGRGYYTDPNLKVYVGIWSNGSLIENFDN